MVIDSHHHLWSYSASEYGWIDDSMAGIRRDFLPVHFEREIRMAGVDGSVLVQARTTIEETHRLLEMAASHPFLLGVVGWVPLDSPDILPCLSSLAGTGNLKGAREVLQGRPAGSLLKPAFNAGIALLKTFDLTYDILIYQNQIQETIELVDRHPEQTFVLDHIAKPRIRDQSLEPWASDLRELARRGNVFCKVSGMVTEADPTSWTPQQLQPYFDVVLEAFGPNRLMFGSDWPVCLVGTDYAQWLGMVQSWTAPLSGAEQAAIFGETAARVYRLG